MKIPTCRLILVTLVTCLAASAHAQTRYTGRAAPGVSRTDLYRTTGGVKAPGAAGTPSVTSRSAGTAARPAPVAPYRSPLTARATPEAPTLPHISKAVAPQSYKSEMESPSSRR